MTESMGASPPVANINARLSDSLLYDDIYASGGKLSERRYPLNEHMLLIALGTSVSQIVYKCFANLSRQR